MKFKKKYLKLFVDVISATTLKFTEARFRDRFSKKLIEEYQQFENDRVKICEDLCEKDAEGKPITNNGVFKFTEKKIQEEAEKEISILKDELVNIVLEGDEPSRLIKLIESTNYIPKLGEAEEVYTEIIEKINNKKPGKK